MKKLIVKYWAGWISPEIAENPGFQIAWAEAAKKAESERDELLVFRVPKNKNMASEIERFLQDFLSQE